jgi:hypothetical protein
MYGQHPNTDNLRLCGEHNATYRLAGNETIICEDRKPFHCLQINYGIPTQGGSMKNGLLDYLTAIVIGLLLCIGLMAWFDILVK